MGTECKQLRGDRMTNLDALLLAGSVWDLGKLVGKQLIKLGLHLGVECQQRVVAGSSSSIGPRAPRSPERDAIGRGIPGDRDNGVVDSRMEDGETARWMYGGRLNAGRLDDV
jgi:hypothetical protein